MGGGTFHAGWYIPWGGVDFGLCPYLVDGWLGVAFMGGGGGVKCKAKVSLLAKALELQDYFAPFSPAAK